MKKTLGLIIIFLAISLPVYSEDKLQPLNNFDTNNNKQYSIILGRCSAIEMTELSLTDPNPDKYFDDMGVLIKENQKFIKFLFPGESETVDAQNAIGLHEYFVSLYQKDFNKHLISSDRSFCEKIKKKIK
jgi:hypothetical protein